MDQSPQKNYNHLQLFNTKENIKKKHCLVEILQYANFAHNSKQNTL